MKTSKKQKTRIRKVPATTNNITKAIINDLISLGYFAFRVNTYGIYSPKLKRWRRSGALKGVADVLACIDGLFYAFEVKTGTDVQSDEQRQFQNNILNADGYYYVIKTYADYLAWKKDLNINGAGGRRQIYQGGN